jgi:hypothetical protein
MTAPELLSTRPAIPPSPRRAPASNAEVRSHSDHHPNNWWPNMQNHPAFPSAARLPADATVTHRHASSPTSISRPLKSHS